MLKNRSKKPPKQAHTSNDKTGSGDSYGVGVKNKIGRIIDAYGINQVSSKKLKNPPRSLA